jgi:hypothetical protein
MQPGDLITVSIPDRQGLGLPGSVLLWDQGPDGSFIVRGRATEGELLLVLGRGAQNTVRVLHPVHGIRLMHTTYARVTLAPDWRRV